MTVRLLLDYYGQPANSLITRSAAEEQDLVDTFMASTDLTGGTTYTAPTPQTQYYPAFTSTDDNNNTVLVDVVAGPVSQRTAVLGDSIAAQNIEYSSGATNFRGKGFLTWANARLGWPFDVQYADNYAIAGTSMAAIISTQLPLLAASTTRYGRVFCSFGTNDANGGATYADMIRDAETIFAAINAAGAIASHIGILPRATSGGMTAAKRVALQFNQWLAARAVASGGRLEYIPCHESIANNADANGYIVAGASQDALHPNDWGAYFIGEAIYNFYSGRGLASAVVTAQSQADAYDATSNPYGVIFDSPNPTLIGGTTAPTGMTSSAPAGSSWAVGTRTLSNGQTKPIVTYTCGGTAGTAYLYDDNLGSGAWDTEEIAEGDTLYAVAVVEVMTAGAGILPYLELTESNGVTSLANRSLVRDQVDCPAIPVGTILTIRTPDVVVRPYGGSGNVSAFVKLNIYNPAASTGVVRVLAFEMRKKLAA